MTTNAENIPGPTDDPAWLKAEEHILDRIASLSMWEAERWAAAHDRHLPRISLLANRLSFLHATGNSPRQTYLDGAFTRIDEAIDELGWTDIGDPGTELAQAVLETMTAVNAVARHAITSVVLGEDPADSDTLAPSGV